MGLGALRTAWQRQTLDFTRPPNDSKYSSLVFDNRGMGLSDVPTTRYSTSSMAQDLLDLVTALGWTGKRQLHIIGVSMGGMIAQEFGLLVPEQIASLTLVSSAARLVNTVGFWENLRQRINLFVPKRLDPQLDDVKARLFSKDWVNLPDEDVNYPGGGKFPTNGDRFAAQEIAKRSSPSGFTGKGFVLQVIAAGWHHKSEEQLKTLGDKVGRERIRVMHGSEDRMISVPHGEVLAKELGLDLDRWDGVGHVLMMEKRVDFNKKMEDIIARCESLSEQ